MYPIVFSPPRLISLSSAPLPHASLTASPPPLHQRSTDEGRGGHRGLPIIRAGDGWTIVKHPRESCAPLGASSDGSSRWRRIHGGRECPVQVPAANHHSKAPSKFDAPLLSPDISLSMARLVRFVDSLGFARFDSLIR